jgi:hypothetical protein
VDTSTYHARSCEECLAKKAAEDEKKAEEVKTAAGKGKK